MPQHRVDKQTIHILVTPTSASCNVSDTTTLARELVDEISDIPAPFTHLASLGNFGAQKNNEERDLHTWTKNLFGNLLQKYKLKLDVFLGGPLYHFCKFVAPGCSTNVTPVPGA